MLNFEHKVISVIGKLINITDNVCLKEKSNKDALTGLYNREFLMNAINNIVKKAKKYYALAVFDIDHFKTINDLLGHPIGDQALILIAKVVEKIVSDKIISARIGGDEFAIFFSGINDQNDIAKKMNELMHKIKREGYRQNISLNLSISIGVSSLYKEKIINFSELYRQADIALYQAKNSGRNCQVFYK
ncbi:GGDEF domain-containing protein [Pectinatus brassicae]|nr:GGDEF domain-containing protein [Pectinatus brassicae]